MSKNMSVNRVQDHFEPQFQDFIQGEKINTHSTKLEAERRMEFMKACLTQLGTKIVS